MLKTLYSPQFVKYVTIGFLGTGLDFLLLYTLVEYAHLYYIFAAIISVSIVLWISFSLNKYWTFRNREQQYIRQLLKYLVSHAAGQILNFSILILLVEIFDLWYIFAKVCATAIVVTWNFLITKNWVFLTKKMS